MVWRWFFVGGYFFGRGCYNGGFGYILFWLLIVGVNRKGVDDAGDIVVDHALRVDVGEVVYGVRLSI